MKKIFSFMLIAAGLLISGQVKADEVTVTTYADLKSQIEGATGERTINVSQDLTGAASITISKGQSITLKLSNNPTITFNAEATFLSLTKGALTVTGQGTLEGKCSLDEGCAFIIVKGSTDQNASNYSVLTLDEGISATSVSGTVVAVANNSNCAYGVKVYVKGFASGDEHPISVNGSINKRTGNVPEMYISGTLKCAEQNYSVPWGMLDPQVIYAAGYAKWYITGTLIGVMGIYAKAGEINITDATITATQIVAEGGYQAPVANNSGTTGGQGSAIVFDSNSAYAGGMVLNISGNTTITASENAYAIDESKTSAANSNTDAVIISGGTINGNINTTAEVKSNCVLNGTITGGTFSDATIKNYVSNVNGVIDVKTSGDETVYVVNGMPSGKDWVTTIAAAGTTDYVKIAANETVSADKEIAYLNIPGANKVTVKKGAKLAVGEAVLGEDAIIEVEAGGKLVINGTNGLIAFVPENLVIKADATDGMGTFVLNPAVKANKTPYATIEFMTNAASGKFDYPAELGAPTDYKWEMIASPFVKMDTIISEVPTYYERIENGAFVQRSKQVIIEETEPFEMIAMCPAAAPKEGGYKYTFVGQLQGANDLTNRPVATKFNYMGNAYTAKLDAQEMITELQEAGSDVRSVIYLWNVAEMKWDVYNSLQSEKLGKINPMAAFVLYSNAAGTMDLSYEKLIWDANK